MKARHRAGKRKMTPVEKKKKWRCPLASGLSVRFAIWSFPLAGAAQRAGDRRNRSSFYLSAVKSWRHPTLSRPAQNCSRGRERVGYRLPSSCLFILSFNTFQYFSGGSWRFANMVKLGMFSCGAWRKKLFAPVESGELHWRFANFYRQDLQADTRPPAT